MKLALDGAMGALAPKKPVSEWISAPPMIEGSKITMNTDRHSRTSLQEIRTSRIAGKRIAAMAGCILLFAAHAHARTIVTDTVASQTSQAQSHVPVTFGQVFKPGDVPRGAGLTASLNGQPVTLQIDAKATNTDGSLRDGVLTAVVPWLPGSAKLRLTIATGSSLPQRDPISLSQLLATNYDATA